MSGALDLDAIRARAEAATEGPWGVATTTGSGMAVHRGAHDTVALYLNRADAEFIVAAREDVPDLLAEVEALRSTIARVRKAVESHIGAPCGCNAIAYQVRAAIEGADS